MRHTKALVRLVMVGLLMAAGCEENDGGSQNTADEGTTAAASSIRVLELGLSFSGTADPASVDIDQDGTADFNLEHRQVVAGWSYRVVYASVTPLAGASLIPSPTPAGTLIGPGSGGWAGTTEIAKLTVGSSTTVSGPWYGVENQYMPIRFVSDGQTHYGWIRMSVDTNMVWTVYDCAYMTEADEPIEMGDH